MPRPRRTLKRWLAARLVETLRMGERKIIVLRTLAYSWGYDELEFNFAVKWLLETGAVTFRQCYGGPRYSLKRNADKVLDASL